MSKSPGPLRALWLLLALVLGVLPMASAVADDSNFRIWGSPSFSGQIQSDDVVVEVAAGGFHSVAVLEDGSMRCWGYNYSGQCDVPSGVGEPGNLVTAVAAGGYHTVALLEDGSIRCWGRNNYGQCDVPSGVG
ncbi:MAG: hypothetical protein P8J45_01365, partial [Phycisphaerales bacterium]|nr:hypothetical protein [Phycisphaerales bacterium]